MFLRSQAFIYNWFPDLLPIFYKHDEMLARALKRSLRSNLHQGSRATQRAPAFERRLTEGEIQGCAELAFPDPPLPAEAGVARELSVGFREAYPILDMGALVRELRPSYDDAVGCLARWKTGLRVRLVFDLSLAEKPCLIICPDEGSNAPELQVIELVQGGRWYMRCPILGTRHDLFFYREGKFASPKANRLVHRSQR
jgi:hypothetical protein